MVGVLQVDGNVSKALITTSSEFAPGIRKDERLRSLMPYRLELKDGTQLREWLLDVKTQSRAESSFA